MNKQQIIQKLRSNKVSKSGGYLEYERAKDFLGKNCTPEEYQFRMKMLANYLSI